MLLTLQSKGLYFGYQESSISAQQWEILLEEQALPESVESCCDVVLMTGKTTAFEQHLAVAKHLLRIDGIVCSLANGLGHEERLVQTFGAHRVFAATTTHGAYRPEPDTFAGQALDRCTIDRSCIIILNNRLKDSCNSR